MQFSHEYLKDLAVKLTATEPAALTQSLIRSPAASEAQSIRSEWLVVARRRMREIEAGTAVTVPADEVLRTLFETTH